MGSRAIPLRLLVYVIGLMGVMRCRTLPSNAASVTVRKTDDDRNTRMSSKRLRALLAELNKELHQPGEVDPETRALLRDLNQEIERVAGEFSESALDRAKELESRFAANHPVAERLARELADILGKMGV